MYRQTVSTKVFIALGRFHGTGGLALTQTFEYTLSGNPAWKLEQVKAAAGAKGIIFCGDLNGGRFSGRGLIGTYSINGSRITVSITTKPLIASWAYIDSQLRSFIEG